MTPPPGKKPVHRGQGGAARSGGPRSGATGKPAAGGKPRKPATGGKPRKPATDGKPRTPDSDKPRTSGSGAAHTAGSGSPRKGPGSDASRTGSGRRAGAARPDRSTSSAPRGSSPRQSASGQRPAGPSTQRGGPVSARGGGAGRRSDDGDRAYAASTPRRPPAPRRPEIPPEAKVELLDRAVRKELSVLLPSTAEEVGGHLVAVGLLIDEEPEQALAHAQAAKQLAARLGCTREALGLAAYRNGDYTTALAELRAARRMGGGPELLPVMADCERGLGRPERALAVGKDPAAAQLDRPGKVELAIVMAGARRDLGQPDAAVLALQLKELDDGGVHPWTPRLWYAYADALLAAGRRDEAAEWFRAVAAEDDEGLFDAEERLAEL